MRFYYTAFGHFALVTLEGTFSAHFQYKLRKAWAKINKCDLWKGKIYFLKVLILVIRNLFLHFGNCIGNKMICNLYFKERYRLEVPVPGYFSLHQLEIAWLLQERRRPSRISFSKSFPGAYKPPPVLGFDSGSPPWLHLPWQIPLPWVGRCGTLPPSG